MPAHYTPGRHKSYRRIPKHLVRGRKCRTWLLQRVFKRMYFGFQRGYFSDCSPITFVNRTTFFPSFSYSRETSPSDWSLSLSLRKASEVSRLFSNNASIILSVCVVLKILLRKRLDKAGRALLRLLVRIRVEILIPEICLRSSRRKRTLLAALSH
jgi:hypothetical protein